MNFPVNANDPGWLEPESPLSRIARRDQSARSKTDDRDRNRPNRQNSVCHASSVGADCRVRGRGTARTGPPGQPGSVMTAPDPLAAFREGGDEERRSLIALADTFSELAACVFSIATGELPKAGEFHLEASVASADALPAASLQSVALGVLLDYAEFRMQERAA